MSWLWIFELLLTTALDYNVVICFMQRCSAGDFWEYLSEDDF